VGDNVKGPEAEKLVFVLKILTWAQFGAEVEALADFMASVPIAEAQGHSGHRCDGITRQEDLNFKQRAEEVGWK
jgi:hypothetical protein